MRLPTRRLRTREPRPFPAPLTALRDRNGEVSPQAAGLSQKTPDAIWQAMKRFYATGMSPGVALALRRNGELFFNRTLGHARLHDDRPLDTETPICLFSASKPVTAMLIHHLAEEGMLELDKPVCHYLPEYGCRGKERTTVMQLLTHRGGIPRIRERVTAEDLFRPHRLRELMIRARPEQPGRRQAYHALTAGFVLGAVVERVTGEDLNRVLDRVIREPMGMKHFRYGLAEGEAAENYSVGPPLSLVDLFLTHAVGGTLDEAVEASNDPRFREVIIPAGNLYATAEEVTRFYQMLLDGGVWNGRRIFREETVRRATAPTRYGARLDRTLLVPMQYSPGFILGQRLLSLYGPGTPRAFGHLGFISIFCWGDPDRALAGALLTTGKGIVGPHYPALLQLQRTINRLTA